MAELLDLAHFKMMTGDDAALQAEVAALFRVQAGAYAGLFAPDAPAASWRDAAHTLKGSARGIGLWPLADACARAEEAAPEEAESAMRALRVALADAIAAIDEWAKPG